MVASKGNYPKIALFQSSESLWRATPKTITTTLVGSYVSIFLEITILYIYIIYIYYIYNIVYPNN